jgi:hypothetical protein
MSAVLLLVLHDVDVLVAVAVPALRLEIGVAVAGLTGLQAGDPVATVGVAAGDVRRRAAMRALGGALEVMAVLL